MEDQEGTMTQQEIQAREELGIIPTSRDVFGKKAVTFDRLVGDLRSAQTLKAQAEQEIKELQAKLQVYFTDSDAKTVLSEQCKVTLVQSSNTRLDKQKLLEAGVPAQTIIDATVSTPYQFVKVTPPKE
jgi:hypothetical protein